MHTRIVESILVSYSVNNKIENGSGERVKETTIRS